MECIMSFKIKYLSVITIFLFSQLLTASHNETLPSYHWAYQYIRDLRLQGGFEDLYMNNQPYTRGEVAKSLVLFRNRVVSGEFDLSNAEVKRFKKLIQEFEPEIREIKNDTMVINNINLGVRLQSDLDQSVKHDIKYRGIYRTKINVLLGKNITAYNGINFDQYLVDNPNYIGKKWRGAVGFTEQAYIQGEFGQFQMKFGRDFLKWGPGRNGTLLLSDHCRPMDQFLGKVQLGPFQYSFMTSLLDEIRLDSEPVDSIRGDKANRYLTAHRLDARLFRGRFQCAITEVILYGGINRQMDWVYLNPFIFYHGAQLNKSGLGNTLGTLDVLFYPARTLEFYGSFLIDDIQIEKTGSGDLEPNEIGYIIGSRYGDAFELDGLTVSTEYIKVTNRTYKTSNPWETFIHRNVPLGHPLGNDFDFWEVDVSQWVGANLWLKFGYSITRHGEGTLFTPFDTPWMDYTVDEGYSEPFPTGVVERIKQLGVEIKFYPSIQWGIQAEAYWQWKENRDHIEGIECEENRWRIGVWFDGDMKINL